VSGFTGTCLDLDDAVSDLRDFELEEPLDQARVRPRNNDLRTLWCAPHFDDVGLLAIALPWALERHLLCLRHERLNAAKIEQRVTRISALDDAGNDVALAVSVFLELALRFDLADPLAHHLPECLSRDPAHLGLLRCVVALVDPVSVFVNVVGDEREVHRFRVDLDDDLVGGIWPTLVCRSERLNEYVKQSVF